MSFAFLFLCVCGKKCVTKAKKVVAYLLFATQCATIFAMKGIIITNQYDHSTTQSKKVLRMTSELEQLGVEVTVLSACQAMAYLHQGNTTCPVDADFVLYFDKDKYNAQMLEQCGLRLFNSSSATELCDDKMLTHIALANCGIPMPTTISAPLCYVDGSQPSKEFLQKVEQTLGFPLVAKQCFGSFGEQVYLVNNREELLQTYTKLMAGPHIYQQFVAESRGKDMRVIVIGNKVVCGMIRHSDSDFRSNIERGGRATSVQVPQDIASMCEQVSKVLGLDYCGIDVLLGEQPTICEVNSNAMFAAMESVTGVNVAKAYAQHIVNSVKNSK